MSMLDHDRPGNDQWAHETIAQSQTCPVCFAPVVKQATRENKGVMLATYFCGKHLWNMSWGLAQVSA